jgi:hypothetical protein
MSKVTLLSENLYIIRETRTHLDRQVVTRYYVTPSTWTTAPTQCTIFTDYDAGVGHLQLYRNRDLKGKTLWADGSTCVYDVVPLYGEIMQSPNGVDIEVKRDGES